LASTETIKIKARKYVTIQSTYVNTKLNTQAQNTKSLTQKLQHKTNRDKL